MFGFLISILSSLVNLPLGFLLLNAFPILINDALLIYIYTSLRGVKGLYTPWCDVVAATLILYFFFKICYFDVCVELLRGISRPPGALKGVLFRM